MYLVYHGLRTPWERAFFKNLELLGLGTHFGLNSFWGIFLGQTISTHFCTVNSLSMFSIIQPFIISTKKTKPLIIPKYLFGSGIWMLAAKNLRFSLRVSVVLVVYHCHGNFRNSWSKVKLTYFRYLPFQWQIQKHKNRIFLKVCLCSPWKLPVLWKVWICVLVIEGVPYVLINPIPTT